MESDALDPATALRAISSAQRDLADRLVTPWWYHPALGLALGLLVASLATDSPWLVTAATVLYVVTVTVLPLVYRRLTGVWVSGFTPPRARRWAFALGITAGAGILVGVLAGRAASPWPGVVVAVGALCFALTLAFGRRFDADLRADLRADPGLART